MKKIKHVPVMFNEVLNSIPKDCKILMDGTVWHGWHSKLILENFKNIKLICVDRDPNIIETAKQNLSEFKEKIQFVRESYWKLESILENKKVDYILLDLWVNMEHFKDAKRWFSIKHCWPLDMRFDTNQKITAEYILKNYTKDKFKDIFEKYWDFKWKLLDEIIRIIIKSRHKLKTTFDLTNSLKEWWIWEKKIAVIFQVIRIEVNQELEQLEMFLWKFQDYLNPWGRCGIITYHSIEDRLTKNRFKELDKNWLKNLTKKVIFPTLEEIEKNKPSRSAKFRLIEKI